MKSNIIRNFFQKGALAVGEHAYDGTIFVGHLPDTGRSIFTTAKASNLVVTWGEAVNCAQHAGTILVHGRADWRIPMVSEVDLLYRVFGGAADKNSRDGSDCFWSSAEFPGSDGAWARSFSSGLWSCYPKSVASSFRLVRG